MCAASQLPGRWPTDVDDAPAINQKSDYDDDDLWSADFFQNHFFFKNSFRNTISECQTDWIQIRPDVVWDLIWVQTVCRCIQ